MRFHFRAAQQAPQINSPNRSGPRFSQFGDFNRCKVAKSLGQRDPSALRCALGLRPAYSIGQRFACIPAGPLNARIRWFFTASSDIDGKGIKLVNSQMILVAGPYRSGTNDDPTLIAKNVAAMTDTSLGLFRAGHLPVMGEWYALPLIRGIDFF